jgi:hypothetical protein
MIFVGQPILAVQLKIPQGTLPISSESYSEEDRQDSLSHKMHTESCKNDYRK